MNENSNLYLMPLCQSGQLSQWPVFNRPTQLTQRTQPVIFVLSAQTVDLFHARSHGAIKIFTENRLCEDVDVQPHSWHAPKSSVSQCKSSVFNLIPKRFCC